jgi:hypothetical protein
MPWLPSPKDIVRWFQFKLKLSAKEMTDIFAESRHAGTIAAVET